MISVTYRVLDKIIPLWQNDVRTTSMMEKKDFSIVILYKIWKTIISNLKSVMNIRNWENYKKENEKRKTSCKTISQFILDIVRMV